MDTIFHLNWLRESASGHLQADLGTVVRNDQLELAVMGLLPEQQSSEAAGKIRLVDVLAPGNLPLWAQRRLSNFFPGQPSQEQLTLVEGFCNRIRDKAWNTEQSELFLPNLGRREWNDRFRILPEMEFERTQDGVVALGLRPHSLREVAMRAAAGAFTQTVPKSTVRFEGERPMIAPWRNQLMDRYGLEVPREAGPLARLTCEAPGSQLAAWHAAPRERHCHYYSIFSRLSSAVQHCLRRWVLASYALGPTELANFEVGGDIVVYAATKPHSDPRARDFSYDVLNIEAMDVAFDRASRRLDPFLKTAYDALMRDGRDEEARNYIRRDVRLHAPKLAQRARKRNRVRSMLVAEGVLIYALLRFAGRLKQLDSVRALTVAVDDLVRDFDERIRKLFYFVPDPAAFSTLLFLEASNAIGVAMGGEQMLKVRAEMADGMAYENVRPMSESSQAL